MHLIHQTTYSIKGSKEHYLSQYTFVEIITTTTTTKKNKKLQIIPWFNSVFYSELIDSFVTEWVIEFIGIL